MSDRLIRDNVDDRQVATITFDRPEKRNAQNGEMLTQICTVLDRLEQQSEFRLLVLRGAGRNFCAGADVSAGENRNAPNLPEVIDRFAKISRPTVTLIQGACIGCGVAWVATSDVAIASDDAFFAIPEVQLGINPASLMPVFIAGMGARQARRYILGGDRFDAAVARESGLVHHLCPTDNLDQAASQVIENLLAGGPNALSAAKRALLEISAGDSRQDQTSRLEGLSRESLNSAEAEEGRSAFRDKRKPNWVKS